jgi:hypothetical protein
VDTPATRARGRLGNALLLLLGIVLGAGLLEMAVRIMAASQPVITTGEQGVYEQFDPTLGWRNRPGASVRYQRREYSTLVEINSLGFRDVERSPRRVPGTTRIIALGDSFVEGYTVERDQTVTRRMEALSESAGCPAEVINAGVHAYSTDQEALWFQNEAEALSPDVVMVFAYYNDILNNTRIQYWGAAKPLVEVVDGKLSVTNLPLPGAPKDPSPGHVEIQPPRPVNGSALRSLMNARTLTGAPRLHRFLSRLGLWASVEPEDIPDELRTYKSRGNLSEFDEAWQKTRDILGSLGRTIRARGASPVLVHVPARFEISDRDWELTTLRYGIDPQTWDRALVRKHLETIASEEGWTFLDLTQALKAAVGVLGGEPYFRYDGHWNQAGHDAAARAAVGFLRERSLLRCGGSAGD